MDESSSADRNTGWEFDLVDEDQYEMTEQGILDDHMAQLGNFDTRHEAIGMKAIVERRFEGYEYEIRAHRTIWEEMDDPVVCGYCGTEAWYYPLVNWYFYEGGPFCCRECCARHAHENTGRYPK